MKHIIWMMILLLPLSSFSVDKVVYGEDNRMDVLEASAQFQNLASSTLALVSKDKFTDGNTLTGETLGVRKNLCADERFFNQVAPATCSSFLVGEDLVVTAGHCIKNQVDCDRFALVFDFYQEYEGQTIFNFSDDQMFECKEVLEQKKTGMLDYSLIRLKRKVVGRTPLKFRKKGKVKKKTPLLIIGQPSGMPTKVSDKSIVRGNFWSGFFTTNADAFGGNSGSAVINAKNFEVEGILVRGEIDYVLDKTQDCMRVKVCKERSCQGEGSTRITKIEYLKNL